MHENEPGGKAYLKQIATSAAAEVTSLPTALTRLVAAAAELDAESRALAAALLLRDAPPELRARVAADLAPRNDDAEADRVRRGIAAALAKRDAWLVFVIASRSAARGGRRPAFDRTAVAVAVALAGHADATLSTFVTPRRIAADLGLDQRAVHRALRDLESAGAVEVTARGGGRGKATVRRLVVPESEKDGARTTLSGATNSGSPTTFSDAPYSGSPTTVSRETVVQNGLNSGPWTTPTSLTVDDDDGGAPPPQSSSFVNTPARAREALGAETAAAVGVLEKAALAAAGVDPASRPPIWAAGSVRREALRWLEAAASAGVDVSEVTLRIRACGIRYRPQSPAYFTKMIREYAAEIELERRRAEGTAEAPIPQGWRPSSNDIQFAMAVGFTSEEAVAIGTELAKEARSSGETAEDWSARYRALVNAWAYRDGRGGAG